MSLPYVINLDEIKIEFSKKGRKQATRVFNKCYRLTVSTLNENREGLTVRQVSEITGRSIEIEEKYLESFHRVDLIEKSDQTYKITDENLEKIENLFGVKL